MGIENRKFEKREPRGIEAISKFFSQKARELMSESEGGLKIKENNLRIDMSGHSNIYNSKKIEKDREYVKNMKDKFNFDLRQKPIEEQEIQIRGQEKNIKLEAIKTALFNKYLGGQFIVVRTSERDDYHKGVDNLIIERKTGNIVSAFDEARGKSMEGKRDKIRRKNVSEGGATIEYGIKIDEDSKKIVPSSKIHSLPIFHLSLSDQDIEDGINNFSINSESDLEKRLMREFLNEIDIQIKDLEEERLKEGIKERVDDFKDSMLEIPKEIWESSFKK